jgi:hypothetical protein
MTRHALLLVAGALALAGCASSPARQRSSVASGPPASPGEGRSELVALEHRIARDLVALGLAPQRDPAEAAQLGEAATRADQPRPAAPPPSPAPAEAPADALAAKSESTERASGGEDACGRDPCRQTRAICDAASRICEIARYLQEADARARCGRALQDCQAARKATQARCPGC